MKTERHIRLEADVPVPSEARVDVARPPMAAVRPGTCALNRGQTGHETKQRPKGLHQFGCA
jgi:hypothetical protein